MAPDAAPPPPVGIARAAKDAWHLAGQFPEKLLAGQKKWKSEASTGQRAKSGCLGVLVFGLAYFILPLIIIVAVEIVLMTWATLLSAAWGISVLAQRKNATRALAAPSSSTAAVVEPSKAPERDYSDAALHWRQRRNETRSQQE